MSVFIVPAGATVINSGDLLQWIAAQLVPDADTPSSLRSLTKQTLLGKNEGGADHWNDEPLTHSDWEMLDHAWKGLPDAVNVKHTDWPAYKDAFEQWKLAHSDEAPPWRLAAMFADHVAEVKVQRSNLFNKHYWALDAMLRNGKTRGITEDRVEASQMGPGVLLPIDQARAYLAQTGFSLDVHTPPPPKPPKTIPAGNSDSTDPEFLHISAEGVPTYDGAAHERYLAGMAKRNAQGLYTMREAARVLANAHALESVPDFIKRRMLPAFDAGLLAVLDPVDGGPVRGRPCKDFSDLVTPEGVNTWLERDGFAPHVRWPVQSSQPQGPDATYAAEPEAPQTDPLPTKTIANLFGDIEFSTEQWVKRLSEAKWLGTANRGRGEQGGASATWCPLTVAQLLCNRKKLQRERQKTLDQLNKRFRSNPALASWKSAWDDYYSMLSDASEC